MVNSMFCVQYHDNLSDALGMADDEGLENPMILLHSGTYTSDYLFIDEKVTLIGAGMYTNKYRNLTSFCYSTAAFNHSTSTAITRDPRAQTLFAR